MALQSDKKPRILLFDLETSPSLGYYFNLYKEGNILKTKEHWHLLSFAYKWLGESKVHVRSLPDYDLYDLNKAQDKWLVQDLWKLFDEADIVIGHNSNAFDNKKANARFVYHGMKPPTPYQTVDTKLVAKRYFRFDSNKLDDLGELLGLGRKLQTGGLELWFGCMEGDKKSWKTMCEYNKQDVVLLEKVYLKLRSWQTNHPNFNVLNGTTECCPNCASDNTHKRGFANTRTGLYQRYKCLDCGAWSQGKKEKMEFVIR